MKKRRGGITLYFEHVLHCYLEGTYIPVEKLQSCWVFPNPISRINFPRQQRRSNAITT